MKDKRLTDVENMVCERMGLTADQLLACKHTAPGAQAEAEEFMATAYGLTKEQLRIAKALGLTPEKMARSLAVASTGEVGRSFPAAKGTVSANSDGVTIGIGPRLPIFS